MRYLVTGCAGFIGYHVVKRLLLKNNTVIGVDSLNNYYDVNLKKNRIKDIIKNNNKKKNFIFLNFNLTNKRAVKKLFLNFKFEIIIHLAAQAGVRYSIKNPHSYIENNIISTTNILECCKNKYLKKIILASSSSVYGIQKNKKFSEKLITDKPISFYAASKIAMESIAYSYYHLYKLPIKIVRFFTVYGPWGRPDMAYFQFTKNIINGKKINVFNSGRHTRDFTYISDIVNFIEKIVRKKKNQSLFEIINLGRGKPEKLMKFISIIEKILKKKSMRIFISAQKGDMINTYANMRSSSKNYKLKAKINLERGIESFINWFKNYYKIKY
jgi:UDP-glucuronate 4-epimerase